MFGLGNYTGEVSAQSLIEYNINSVIIGNRDRRVNFNENFICKNNEHPILLKLFLGKQISLETFCLLLEFSGAKSYWDSKMQYDLVWDNLKTKVEKYSPFINCDKDKLKKIVLDYFEEQGILNNVEH